MSDRSNTERDEEGTEEFLELVKRSLAASSSDERLWDALTSDTESVDVPDALRTEAVRRATLALSIARGDLTLGKYLSRLRTEAHLSRDDLAKASSLSPDVVAQLEADRWRVLSVQPQRMAVLAAAIGAIRAAFLELVSRSAQSSPVNQALPRITRMDVNASMLESERAVRRTQNAHSDNDLEEYLRKLASAFDAEVKRIRPT